MSAFRISDETWQNIVDALCLPNSYGDTIEGTLKRDYGDILKDWYAANDRAVASRYHEPREGRQLRMKPSKLVQEARDVSQFGSRVVTQEKAKPLVQYIKSIQCLKYQCSEDVPASELEAHEKAMAEMDQALRILGERLASALPEYEKAAWNF